MSRLGAGSKETVRWQTSLSNETAVGHGPRAGGMLQHRSVGLNVACENELPKRRRGARSSEPDKKHRPYELRCWFVPFPRCRLQLSSRSKTRAQRRDTRSDELSRSPCRSRDPTAQAAALKFRPRCGRCSSNSPHVAPTCLPDLRHEARVSLECRARHGALSRETRALLEGRPARTIAQAGG